MSVFEDYPCVGVCEDDPDSGYCIGCGRPPLPGYGPAAAATASAQPGSTVDGSSGTRPVASPETTPDGPPTAASKE